MRSSRTDPAASPPEAGGAPMKAHLTLRTRTVVPSSPGIALFWYLDLGGDQEGLARFNMSSTVFGVAGAAASRTPCEVSALVLIDQRSEPPQTTASVCPRAPVASTSKTGPTIWNV